jgi:hypothetical protein
MSPAYNFPLAYKSPYRNLMLFLSAIILVADFKGEWLAFTDAHSSISDKILMTAACGGLFIILLNAFIRTASIHADANGLNRVIFGKVCYRLEWNEIKRIRIKDTPDFGTLNSRIAVYYLDKNEAFHLPNTKNAPFFFNSKRENIRDLLDIITTECALKYHVPVIDYRESPPVTVDRL